MAISAYSATPASNTAISGINLAENCNASGINDAIRQLMADLAAPAFGTGAASFGGTLTVAGATTLSGASAHTGAATFASTLGVTGVLSGTTAAFSGSLAVGSTAIPVSTSAAGSPAGTNFFLAGGTSAFTRYIITLIWAGGDGFAQVVINSAGGVTTIGSSNALGNDNCFDTTNNTSSNGANGIALFVSSGSVVIQTKNNYAGGPITVHRYGG